MGKNLKKNTYLRITESLCCTLKKHNCKLNILQLKKEKAMWLTKHCISKPTVATRNQEKHVEQSISTHGTNVLH